MPPAVGSSLLLSGAFSGSAMDAAIAERSAPAASATCGLRPGPDFAERGVGSAYVTLRQHCTRTAVYWLLVPINDFASYPKSWLQSAPTATGPRHKHTPDAASAAAMLAHLLRRTSAAAPRQLARGISQLTSRRAPSSSAQLRTRRPRALAGLRLILLRPGVGRVSDKDRTAYDRDGAIVVRGAFSKEWVDTLRAVAEANLKAPGPLVDEHVPKGEPGAKGHAACVDAWRVAGVEFRACPAR